MGRPARALIVACEHYVRAEDVAPELPGTLKAATGFYNWLVGPKGVAAGNIHICCDDPLIAAHPASRTYKSDRGAIVAAIIDLCQDGRDNTGELFVFFSGHGVGWQFSPQQRGLDVVLASDYRKRQLSGSSCIKVDELRGEMRKWLGGEDHYYFLDACRTVMQVGEIQPADLGLTLPLAANEEPTTYVLYATRFGEPARVNSGFSEALVEGLKGAGRAKQRVQGSWWVRFDRVQKFVQERVKAKIDLAKEGTRDGLILPLAGSQTSLCTVMIDDAMPAQQFGLTVDINGIQQTFNFAGGSFEKDLVPNVDGYQFSVTANGIPLERLDPPVEKIIDLFDPACLRFRQVVRTRSFRIGTSFEELDPIGTVALATMRPPGPAGLEIPHLSEPDLEVRVRSAATGNPVGNVVAPMQGAQWLPLPAGRYVVEVTERGRVVRSDEIALAPSERLSFDFLRQPDSRVQRSIAAKLPTRSGLPDASETLGGPLLDQDTSVWLSVLGASRLIRSPSEFSKLRLLPLATFDDLREGDSVVYAVAGLDSGDGAQLAVSDNATVTWHVMAPVDGIDGLFHLRSKQAPGPKLVSFAVPGMPPVTYATYALPNRSVLIVFDLTSSGRLITRQMLLPVYSLAQFLDETVRQRFDDERLGLVRYLTLAQESFASRRSLEPVTLGEQARWDDMLNGEWIDPLLALMAIFEVARRGRTQDALQHMPKVIENLTRCFGELPDVGVANGIFGSQSPLPPGAPLLLESLQRVADIKKALPLPADFLDYNSMWTSWLGAVRPPA